MMRGTFANIRIKNERAPGTEGGYTTLYPEGKVMPVFEAVQEYKKRGTDLVVIGGKEYGTGSSRDWAAKGTKLLGIKYFSCEIKKVKTQCRIDTNNELEYYKNGGILQYVLRKMI